MADCCSWGLQRVQVGLVESRSRGPDWRRRPDPAGFDRLVASGQVAPLDFERCCLVVGSCYRLRFQASGQ